MRKHLQKSKTSNLRRYKNEQNTIVAESNSDLYQIEHNAIMEQFDDLYDRENSLRWKEIMR